MEQEQKKPIQSLKEHIDNNINLYTVFGILNALTIFSLQITPASTLTKFLTFSFLSLSIIIWGIIKFSINRDESTFALFMYVFFVDVAAFCMISYWAVVFREGRNWFLFFFGVLFYAHIFGNFLYGWLTKFKILKTRKDSIVTVIIGTMCIIASAFTVPLIEKIITYLAEN